MKKLLLSVAFLVLGGMVGCALQHSPQVPPAQDASVDRAKWMREARWGVFTHYLADWKAQDLKIKMTVEKWNEMVDHFDAEGLADQLQRMGAKYYVLTIGQNSGYYLSPNATYDKIVGITPSKLSHRDLIADVADAVHKRGIHFMVYLPAGAPGGEAAAVEKLEYHRGPNRNAEFQRHWEAIMAEWSNRWGDRVEGWWFDGCYWPNNMYRYDEAPNFKSFAAAARAGNPKALVAFNTGVSSRLITQSEWEDYTAGETNDPASTLARRIGKDGKLDGTQPQILTYLGATWGKGAPRFPDAAITDWARKVSRTGTAITVDVPIEPGGHIAPAFEAQIAVLRKTIDETPVVLVGESSTRPRRQEDGTATQAAETNPG